jgi:hypothetical protein
VKNDLTQAEWRRSRDYALECQVRAEKHIAALVACADDYFGGKGDCLGFAVADARRYLAEFVPAAGWKPCLRGSDTCPADCCERGSSNGIPLPNIPGETAKSYKARLAASKEPAPLTDEQRDMYRRATYEV